MKSSALTAEMLEEFQAAAASSTLREDMDRLRRNRVDRERRDPLSPEEFLRFLTSFSELAAEYPQRHRKVIDTFMVL